MIQFHCHNAAKGSSQQVFFIVLCYSSMENQYVLSYTVPVPKLSKEAVLLLHQTPALCLFALLMTENTI